MPPLEESEPTEIITLYTIRGVDEFGHIAIDTGIEIRARWVQTNRQAVLPDTSQVAIIADVVVDRLVKIGSLLWRGRKVNYEDGTGTADVGLCEVREIEIVPDVKGQATRYSVGVSRYLQKKTIT